MFYRCAASVAFVALAFGAAATAQHLYDFGPREDPEVDPGSASVKADLGLLTADQRWLELQTPDGSVITAELTRFRDRGEGSVTWSGREIGADNNTVLLTVRDGHLFGTFGDLLGQRYKIYSGPNGGRVSPIIREDAPEGVVLHAEAKIPPIARRAVVRQSSPSTAVRQGVRTKPHKLKVLVLWTRNAEVYWLDWYPTNPIPLLIQHANDYIEETFNNGQIPVYLELAHSERAPASIEPSPGYGWGGDWPDLLAEDSAVRKLRGHHRADIVILYVHDSTAPCGHAWLRDRAATDREFAPYAVAMANLECDDRNVLSFWKSAVHEVGHIFGAQHDPPNADLSRKAFAIAPYGYGHNDNRANGIRSVMSYGAGSRVPYFSTSRISPNGWTLGIKDKAENERVLQAMAGVTARYGGMLLPAGPRKLTAKAGTAAGSVELRWDDAADNETHYVVKYRRAGPNQEWKNVPTGSYETGVADVTKATVRGLKSDRTYLFRVRCVNEYGGTMSRSVRIRTR